MAKINVLSPEVYNRIAAGEVVERPASIVKELVENSLDSGATKIEIEITGGGLDGIKITDNGCGMGAEDVSRAFLPHATSKIKKADDLSSIATLGFRGEALSSIAAVSRVVLTSKTKKNESASFIEIENGQVLNKGEKGAPDGTQVFVTKLFYNIPARLKFLKKPSSEGSEITNTVSRLILANPKVAFVYISDGKRIYQTTGKSEEDTLISVYSASVMQNIVPVSGKKDGIKLHGFVGKPRFSKPNRTYQTLIINGRFVQNYAIASAVLRAYSSFLMKNQFPFFVLYLNLPPDEVDVNVHPNKLEVRIEDGQKIYGLIYSVIEEALLNFSKNNAASLQEKDFKTFAEFKQEKTQEAKTDIINLQVPSSAPQFDSDNIKSNSFNQNHVLNSNIFNNVLSEIVLEKRETIKQALQEEQETEIKQSSIFDNNKQNDFNLTAKIIGKMFNTFLVLERKDKIYIIDQHAAHERILFDALLKEAEKSQAVTQLLLVPFVLNVNHAEEQFIKNNIAVLKVLGFEMEEFGFLTFKISGIPAVLSTLDIGAFFNEILKNLSRELTISTAEILRDKLAQAACKAAVKAGMDLKENEIETLLAKLKEQNNVLLCPHGRPIIIELSRTQIDKWFKRVL